MSRPNRSEWLAHHGVMHAARNPRSLSDINRARMAAAVARHDARIATAQRKARIARLAYACGALALSLSIFYSV
jgi:hypothetical protein